MLATKDPAQDVYYIIRENNSTEHINKIKYGCIMYSSQDNNIPRAQTI